MLVPRAPLLNHQINGLGTARRVNNAEIKYSGGLDNMFACADLLYGFKTPCYFKYYQCKRCIQLKFMFLCCNCLVLIKM